MGAEQELNARLALAKMESDLESEKDKLAETQVHIRHSDRNPRLLKKESLFWKKEFTAGINTERELESIEQEAGHARKQLDDMEMRMLELTVAADSFRARITELETELEVQKALGKPDTPN
ncbi:MAG: hypothetical protein Ct9H300mP27_09960 [Chloroflexota bacterium]|nr:MAG: hypothetical protein Ct9H300mP27_09960 [Chloroflexota bacterium]